MLKIDSHQHFWKFDAVRHSWINEEMNAIQQDFMPGDLGPLLEENGIDGCVLIQVDQTPEENDFQLQNAAQYDFIKGVVGWVDLQAEDIEDQLHELKGYEKLKGFRHILQGESDRALMLKPAFLNGISKLRDFGFTYDILIFPDQLQYAAELVSQFPDQPFVLDHIAKPDIKNQRIEGWKQGIQELAKYDNVYCKASGMVTEADWKLWKPEDFTPYLDVVFEAFGAGRVMYGTDWPVSLVAASYGQVKDLVKNYISKCSANEQELFWGGNATEFYKLK
ncbi:amidohydrolase family protein [Pedobacter psychroterrae]|uniref:Amidohydrolase n=1 Tax=Pedobacter psychroterrae TaxID=2530453 RepID=A0A4R0NRF8_9SPHI|nr:amidohydrolase family protein [Pedobacter psychroterrae]TCD02769.1 amidohydrolase [Pedobacter psychroterrae]